VNIAHEFAFQSHGNSAVIARQKVTSVEAFDRMLLKNVTFLS